MPGRRRHIMLVVIAGLLTTPGFAATSSTIYRLRHMEAAVDLRRNFDTHSSSSDPKEVFPFVIELFETDGALSDAGDANATHAFTSALNAFVSAELSTFYAGSHAVKDVLSYVLSNEEIEASATRGRNLQEKGVALEVAMSVEFDEEPSPDSIQLAKDLEGLMDDLSFLVSNITDTGHPELQNVHSAFRRKSDSPEPSDEDDTPAPTSVDQPVPIAAPRTSNAQKTVETSSNGSLSAIVPSTLAAAALVALATYFVFRRRRHASDESETKGQLVYIDAENDAHSEDPSLESGRVMILGASPFQVESALRSPGFSSTRCSPVSSNEFEDTESPDFTDDDNEYFMNHGRGSKSVFSAITATSATTVLASNVGPENTVAKASATTIDDYRMPEAQNTGVIDQNGLNNSSLGARSPHPFDECQEKTGRCLLLSDASRNVLSDLEHLESSMAKDDQLVKRGAHPSMFLCVGNIASSQDEGPRRIDDGSPTDEHKSQDDSQSKSSPFSPSTTTEGRMKVSPSAAEMNAAAVNIVGETPNEDGCKLPVQQRQTDGGLKGGSEKRSILDLGTVCIDPEILVADDKLVDAEDAAASAEESLNQGQQDDMPSISHGPSRRHVGNTGVDGSALYQASAMHPLDWSYRTDEESANDSISTAPHVLKKEGMNASSLLGTGLQSPQSVPESKSQASSNNQLIHDLVWLEKKIARVRHASSGSTQEEVPQLESVDSLSYMSNDVLVSTASLDSVETGHVSSIQGGTEPSNIVCQECVVPPGKLHIVIHSTKDGPAVHSVKTSSPLYGKIYPGDLIISVDNVDTRSFTAEEVMKMMAARSGYERKLTVIHIEES